MKPKSGNYKIKFKINQIDNNYWANIIGIITETGKNNINIGNNDKNIKDSMWWWCNKLYNYIGWTACGHEYGKSLPNGLFGGLNDDSIKNNIFRKNKFIYHSNNENYKNRLPRLENGNIIVLEYNSDLAILSFSKENDNGKLDSYIENLPTDETFYWFVGHFLGKLSVSVVY